jgi:predicted fused transcriptional regulator/phosphomethylpyrimidine kinase
MFRTIQLKRYAEKYSQAEAGRQLGYTRANIAAAISANRDVTLVVNREGRIFNAYEVKPFGESK